MSGMRIGWAAAVAVLAVTAAGCGLDAEPAAGDPVVTQTVTETATATEPTGPTEAAPSVQPVAEEPTYVVTHVVDGDTIDLDSGDTVRLVGIDTPERGECGFGPAQSALKRLVLDKEVTLVESDEDADKYGRLLRFVEVDGLDVGLRLIRKGLAIARYDSRDGYGRHAREDRYITADEAAADVTCPKPKPEPDQEPRGFADTGGGGHCEAGYDPCVPPYPPDLDCADVGPVTVTGSDPHGLDGDGDGVACGGD